jgi:cation transport regulator ChaC
MSATSRKYYFAYGSNMDREQMGKRCPGAELVSVGTISGWRFRINTRGVATIVPESGSTLYGIVWCLSEADERALDRYEGVAKGLYAKRTMEVRLGDGRSVKAFVYLAKDSQPGIAKPGYMSGILTAAISNAFPSSYVQELRAWSTTGE